MISPIKGEEVEFYAGDTMIPITKTMYDENNKQLIIKFEKTKLSDEIKNVMLFYENSYIKGVSLFEDRIIFY